MGQPGNADLDFNTLANNTRVAFPDLDASPTKAWIILNKHLPGMDVYYQFAFGKRPEEELYKIKTDPYQTDNLASDPEFMKVKQELREKLLLELTTTGDPRVTGDGQTFERPPYSGPIE